MLQKYFQTFFLLMIGRNVCSSSEFYDSFYGTPITMQELKVHDKANTTFWCVSEMQPCDPYEGRRVDGSCNNLKHPSRGASHTPFYQMLPRVFGPGKFGPGFEPRSSKNGSSLPLARFVRTSLLAEGKVPDQKFTQLLAYFLAFVTSDITAIHDTVNYILWKPYCCLPQGKNDPDCVPNEIPEDDPVHRFSGLRCMNLTRPISFQSTGCLSKTIEPERITSSTPLFDLSMMYGSTLRDLLEKGRLFRGGLLKFEEDSRNRIWPPSSRYEKNVCLLNEKPFETRCHDGPNVGMNSLLGVNLFGIWFWREHNRIANELAALNPCWTDEKLFYYARDINIATYSQILYNELFPALMGRKNLIRDGVISSSLEFRDLYNEEVVPQLSAETLAALRWTHTFQEGTLKMYDEAGRECGEYPVVDLTLKTGYLATDRHLEGMTQGSFRQPGAKIDYVADPDMAERALGPHQRAADVLTSDLSKSRYSGFAPYVKYLEYCKGRPYGTFDDLLEVIDPERVEQLKALYRDVEDIDLTAGIWVEKPIKDGHVPHTFYCIMVDQLVRSVVSDRHWFERSERPLAFSGGQLREIRKASIARILCDNGDSVTQIQPRPFERIGLGNELVDCKEIKSINLKPWKDYSSCSQGQDEAYENWSHNAPKNAMRG